MQISRNFEVGDWKRLAFKSESDWPTAIAIFQDRLETRYLEHIRTLLLCKTSGFAVLALDCVLIETLEQFRQGTRKTPSKKGKAYFVSFLTGTSFSEHISEDLATLFYVTIRCGLLHQAEAEGTSRVKRGSSSPVIAYTVDHSGVVVNAHAFHSKLELVIREYVDELRNPKSVEARDAFRKKMNFIYRNEEKGPDKPLGGPRKR